MAEARYQRINTERDAHAEQDEDDIDISEARSDIHIFEDASPYNYKQPDSPVNIMQAPSAILALIFIYFGLSISLTFYQRGLLKEFHFPFFVVLYHLILKQILSAIIRILYKCVTGRSRIHLDWRKSVRKIAPTGIASGIDIGFSNWGLELVTISLYTMTKSTTIIFILIFAILLGLEKKSWSLMVIVVMISTGLCMFTYKSTQFNALGFAFLLFASLSSGIRWSFAQLIMQKSKLGLHNPIDMIYYMQPWMVAAILPLAIGFEGERFIEMLQSLPSSVGPNVGFLCIKITIGAFIAFAMEISEFLVLSYTSSLTLSVAGIFKEICQLVLAVVMNGDQLSTTNILGLSMCLGGICSHVIHKFSSTKNPFKIPVIDDIVRDVDGTISNVAPSHNNHTFNSHNSNNNKQQIKLNYYSGQNLPLLESSDEATHSDSDISPDNQNASEVIFDVLKRRDARR